MVKEVFGLIRDLRAEGPAIMLVEQAVRDALPLADWVTVLVQDEVAASGDGGTIVEVHLARVYLGTVPAASKR